MLVLICYVYSDEHFGVLVRERDALSSGLLPQDENYLVTGKPAVQHANAPEFWQSDALAWTPCARSRASRRSGDRAGFEVSELTASARFPKPNGGDRQLGVQ